MLFIRLVRESFIFAVDSLIVNKLRTILSLLGITIGIFAMISVFTMVDSLEKNIRNSISSLGNNVVYIQKWPWSFESDRPWWDYLRRPQPDMDEFKFVQKYVSSAEAVAMNIGGNTSLQYNSNTVDRASYVGITYDYVKIWDFDITEGRYFTELETNAGRPIAIVGSKIASGLFEDEVAIGKRLKLMGRKVEVVGVLKKEGESMLGQSKDNQIFIPLNFARNLVDIRNESLGATIMVKAKEDVSNEQLMDELTGIMRSVRKLKPKVDNDFALNELSMLSQGFDGIFGMINVAGAAIGIFSIIVGGFSIANIMFVSVKERTSIIGIQKSLGAKNYFILFQFLFEAIFLCIIGGAVGLLIIYLGTLLLQYGMDFEVALSFENIGLGLAISISIGLISGIVPSWSASRLDPVEAIRSNG